MNVRYRVELSQTERAELVGLLSGGKLAVRKLKRAQILLAADAGASDAEITGANQSGAIRRRDFVSFGVCFGSRRGDQVGASFPNRRSSRRLCGLSVKRA